MFLPQVELVVDPRILLLPLINESLHLLDRAREVKAQKFISIGARTGCVSSSRVVRGVTLRERIILLVISPSRKGSIKDFKKGGRGSSEYRSF